MPRGPHPIDIHVGQRLRAIRTLRNMSQEKLGQRVGLTFQQIQKYERGTNRISASRLYEFSEILEISVLDFYAGLGNANQNLKLPCLTKNEMVWLDIFNSLENHKIRHSLKNLALAIKEEIKGTTP